MVCFLWVSGFFMCYAFQVKDWPQAVLSFLSLICCIVADVNYNKLKNRIRKLEEKDEKAKENDN